MLCCRCDLLGGVQTGLKLLGKLFPEGFVTGALPASCGLPAVAQRHSVAAERADVAGGGGQQPLTREALEMIREALDEVLLADDGERQSATSQQAMRQAVGVQQAGGIRQATGVSFYHILFHLHMLALVCAAGRGDIWSSFNPLLLASVHEFLSTCMVVHPHHIFPRPYVRFSSVTAVSARILVRVLLCLVTWLCRLHDVVRTQPPLLLAQPPIMSTIPTIRSHLRSKCQYCPPQHLSPAGDKRNTAPGIAATKQRGQPKRH